MKTRVASFFLLGVLVAAGLTAQTKASGTATCKPDPAAPPPVAVSDMPNHSFAIGRALCTWTKFTVGGQAYKDGVSTSQNDINGDTNSFTGYHVATTPSGDTSVSKFQGTGKMKDGNAVSGEGTWTFVNGTGKLKGIKGKGTFKGAANPDGSMTYQVEGEYQLP